MKKIQWALACLACVGMVSPTIAAEVPAPVGSVASKPQIADVTLAKGVLSGKVVSSSGVAEAGKTVKVSLGSNVVGTSKTDADGQFAINNLKNGLYQVSTGDSQSVVRLWDSEIAPPAAKSKVLIINGQTVRSQGGDGIDPLTGLALGLGVTGVTLGGVAISDDGGDQVIVSP